MITTVDYWLNSLLLVILYHLPGVLLQNISYCSSVMWSTALDDWSSCPWPGHSLASSSGPQGIIILPKTAPSMSWNHYSGSGIPAILSGCKFPVCWALDKQNQQKLAGRNKARKRSSKAQHDLKGQKFENILLFVVVMGPNAREWG